LRARPEPTQSEHLLGASFLGKLLVLPANVRLDWKVIAKYKHSLTYLAAMKETSFITLTPDCQEDKVVIDSITNLLF